MSTITDTYIANLALAHLGDGRIQQFNQRDPSAAKVRDHWEFARMEALSAYEWSFASRIVKLSLAGEMPIAEYSHRHDKPNDWIRTNRIAPSTNFRGQFLGYTDRDSHVESNSSLLYMDYVYDHTEIGKWPMWFVNYMAVSLASMINPSITTSKAMKKDMMQIKREVLSSARSRDNQQSPNRRHKDGSWIKARRGGGMGDLADIGYAGGTAVVYQRPTTTPLTPPSGPVAPDTTSPTILITGIGERITSPVTATFTFSEDVTGFTGDDIAVSNAVVSEFAGSGDTYTATITPVMQGIFTVDVAADVAVDVAGNGNEGAAQVSSTYDSLPPTIVITGVPANSAEAFTATFTFSEIVIGFNLSDITVGNGIPSNFSGTGDTYTALITPSVNGQVTIDVAADVAVDAHGNGNTVADQSTSDYNVSQPSVVISGVPANTNSAFTATITFSQPVFGFVVDYLVLGNATASNFSGSEAVYTALVTPTSAGAFTIDVPADVAVNGSSIGNTAATQAGGTYTVTAPDVAITGVPATSIAAFTATFTFSEIVTGFVADDITVTNANVSNFSGTGAVYTADITGIADGDITVDVNANVAIDSASNGNTSAVQQVSSFSTTVPALFTPTLEWDGDNMRFVIELPASLEAGDIIRMQIADDDGFTTNLEEATHTLTASEIALAHYDMQFPVLGSGTFFAQLRLEKPSASAVSDYTNSVTFTLATINVPTLAFTSGTTDTLITVDVDWDSTALAGDVVQFELDEDAGFASPESQTFTLTADGAGSHTFSFQTLEDDTYNARARLTRGVLGTAYDTDSIVLAAGYNPLIDGPLVYLDYSDLSTLKQEITGDAATTPVAIGDPVGSIQCKGSDGGYWVAPSEGKRGTLQQRGTGEYYIESNGVDQNWGRIGAPLISGPEMYVIAGFEVLEVSAYERIISARQDGNNDWSADTGFACIVRNASTGNMHGQRSTQSLSSAALALNTPMVVESCMRATDHYMSLNGGTDDVSAHTVTANMEITHMQISSHKADSPANEHSKARHSGLIVFASDPSPTIRSNLQTYMASKTGS